VVGFHLDRRIANAAIRRRDRRRAAGAQLSDGRQTVVEKNAEMPVARRGRLELNLRRRRNTARGGNRVAERNRVLRVVLDDVDEAKSIPFEPAVSGTALMNRTPPVGATPVSVTASLPLQALTPAARHATESWIVRRMKYSMGLNRRR